MHDMIEVKHKDYNSHWKLVPLPAWSVDFDSSRYPVVAYRVIKKADADEIERLREALQHLIRWHDQLSATDIAKAREALKEKE
jgi:hypothetical protein